MSCRAVAPLVLLSVLTWRVVDLWRAGDLDPVTLLLVPVAAGLVWWLVRQPGCDGAACATPVAVGTDHEATADVDADHDPSTPVDRVAHGTGDPWRRSGAVGTPAAGGAADGR